MENQDNKRVIFMLSGVLDSLLGAIALLIYFGILPFNISNWGIPRWGIGLAGGVLFFTGIAMFAYFSTKTDVIE
jgi:integral membrane sensor domain MASE1